MSSSGPAVLLLCLGLAACAPAAPPDRGCTGHCADADSQLSAAEVEQVLAGATAEARARDAAATIAVVDRVGNVLAVFRMNGAATGITISSTPPGAPVRGGLEGIDFVPDSLAAISKAITAAYLSTEGNAFSTRTASQIVQEHFNPGELKQPGGPLFGVQFSQLPCSDFMLRAAGEGPGPGPQRAPLGLSADPGGLPLYRDGVPVGGIGVIADGVYGLDKNVTGGRDSDLDELIALAGSRGRQPPTARRADRITVDGKLLRYADARLAELLSAPQSSVIGLPLDDGSLLAVPGYNTGRIVAGTAFGQPASGIRPATDEFAALDGFVLVDADGAPRFPARAGTDGAGALTEVEVRSLLFQALTVANRARGQIRRPLGQPARVSITVVDTAGQVLGLVRSRDAPMFGLDVAVQKARTATFFSSAAAAASLRALPQTEYVSGADRPVPDPVSPGDYVDALRSFLGLPEALADGAFAFADRSGGNLSRPFYPDGIDGNPPGPLSKGPGFWSPFSVGLQLDLVYNAVIQHVAFAAGLHPTDVGSGCTGVGGLSTGFAAGSAIDALANGIQIFPGSVPVYRGSTLVGGIGVSGDGVDQDDMIAFLGVDQTSRMLGTINNAPPAMRADNIVAQGNRLRFVNCPQNPFLDTSDQDVCDGL